MKSENNESLMTTHSKTLKQNKMQQPDSTNEFTYEQSLVFNDISNQMNFPPKKVKFDFKPLLINTLSFIVIFIINSALFSYSLLEYYHYANINIAPSLREYDIFYSLILPAIITATLLIVVNFIIYLIFFFRNTLKIGIMVLISLLFILFIIAPVISFIVNSKLWTYHILFFFVPHKIYIFTIHPVLLAFLYLGAYSIFFLAVIAYKHFVLEKVKTNML